jgi:hypothetical protein
MDQNQARSVLLAQVSAETARPVSGEAQALSDALRARHGANVAATLFYGSCLRPPATDALGPGGADERLYDFYLIVDDLRAANSNVALALGNRILPPNIFYIDAPFAEGKVRAKYAVVTLAQFVHGCSARHFHNYFWGRFAQPAAVPFARDDATKAALDAALADAIVTLLGHTAPLLGSRFSAEQLWSRGFAESYRCELRPESSARALQLFAADALRYTALALPGLQAAGIAAQPHGALIADNSGQNEAWRARHAWLLRRIVGKTFNVLRLIKASFTFAGGVDYIVWKIERHSGIRPELTPWQRRHPLLAAPVLALRYRRRGAFR